MGALRFQNPVVKLKMRVIQPVYTNGRLLTLHREAAIPGGTNHEGVTGAAPVGQLEPEAYTEVSRVPTRAASHIGDATMLANGVVQRGLHCIGEEPERFNKIALARSIAANEHRQWRERYARRRDALIVLERNGSDSAGLLQSGVSFAVSSQARQQPQQRVLIVTSRKLL